MSMRAAGPPSSTIGPALLPGGLVAYLGFSAGGFFPQATAVAVIALLVVLGGWTLVVARPWAFASLPWAACAGALGALALLQVVSGAWSDAPARGLLEGQRTVLYALAVVVGALAGRSVAGRRWLLRGLAAGGFAVCLAGFASRTLPDLVTATVTNEPDRLSHPVTYWNAMGLVAAMTLVACAALAADVRESRVGRVLGAAAVPVVAATLLLTFSRGPMAVALAGLALLVLLGRPAGLPGLLVAGGAPAAVAVGLALGADALASAEPQSDLAVQQGSDLALGVAVLCLVAGLLRALLLRLDVRLGARPPASPRTRRLLAAALGVTLVATLAVLLAAGVVGDQVDRFVDAPPLEYADQRDRLLDVGNNGRVDIWEVAWEALGDEPLRGTGAGTFAQTWALDRPSAYDVVDGHSVYLETLAELGLPGLLLLLAALGLALGGLAVRALRDGPDRTLGVAGLALASMWAVHAGIDWDWEMPVTTLPVFALGGAALAAPAGRSRLAASVPGRLPRVLGALACLLLAVTPVRIALAQSRLDAAVEAFRAGDCDRASDRALAAVRALPGRSEPWEVLAFCNARAGQADLAERAAREARRLDPRDWETSYALAVVRAAAGRPPGSALQEAMRRNPRHPWPAALAADVAAAGGDRDKLRRAASDAPLPVR